MKGLFSSLSIFVLLAFTLSYPAPHVFWYKALTNGYSLTHCNPGPCLDAGSIVHEGMIATGCVAQHSGASDSRIAFGSGLDDQQGRCSFIWSKDLNNATGAAASAMFRAEYQDGWCGNALCNAGPINIRCGVVDFQGNLDTWGGADYVPETADWQDFLNPLSSSMGFDFMTPTLQSEEVISFTAPAGKQDEFSPSVLDGQFVEVDITDQVNWILQNSGHMPLYSWYRQMREIPARSLPMPMKIVQVSSLSLAGEIIPGPRTATQPISRLMVLANPPRPSPLRFTLFLRTAGIYRADTRLLSAAHISIPP